MLVCRLSPVFACEGGCLVRPVPFSDNVWMQRQGRLPPTPSRCQRGHVPSTQWAPC